MLRTFASLVLLLSSAAAWCATPSALFYMTESPDSIRAFLAHADQVDVLVPTWYQVDENGLVTGAPDPLVLAAAQAHHVPVMPILALFNKKSFHELSSNTHAQDLMNEAMVREARLHGYSGFQYDFENVEWTDRDALTATVARSADALHKAGLQLSIA
ncbi:MAG TPA: glycosyl hydrolase, partial [Terracidiphilus sp.]|nr:glycosyl hydrolase [Terracidiphilus sp.]